MHDSRRRERQWAEITLVLGATAGRSGLRVPVELGGGQIGTLEVFTTTSPVEAKPSQCPAGLCRVVVSLLAAAARSKIKGALAEQLQVAAPAPRR